METQDVLKDTFGGSIPQIAKWIAVANMVIFALETDVYLPENNKNNNSPTNSMEDLQ